MFNSALHVHSSVKKKCTFPAFMKNSTKVCTSEVASGEVWATFHVCLDGCFSLQKKRSDKPKKKLSKKKKKFLHKKTKKKLPNTKNTSESLVENCSRSLKVLAVRFLTAGTGGSERLQLQSER